jgi:HPt (histidine-containing phosphotransfer) domain-containing protein
MSQKHAERLSSVVDYEELVTRCLNKIDFAERMLALLQNHCGDEMAVLERAYAEGNLESVRLIAHRLGGAAANAAAFGIQSCAADLRLAASSGSVPQTSRSFKDLQREWRRFNEVMTADAQPIESN